MQAATLAVLALLAAVAAAAFDAARHHNTTEMIAALENAGLDPTTIPVSGQDATAAGMQNIVLGKQAMSVYKPIAAEAAVGAEIALALRDCEDVAEGRLEANAARAALDFLDELVKAGRAIGHRDEGEFRVA